MADKKPRDRVTVKWSWWFFLYLFTSNCPLVNLYWVINGVCLGGATVEKKGSLIKKYKTNI